MKARIKSNQKIATGVIADILVKAKKAVYIDESSEAEKIIEQPKKVVKQQPKKVVKKAVKKTK